MKETLLKLKAYIASHTITSRRLHHLILINGQVMETQTKQRKIEIKTSDRPNELKRYL